MATDRALDLIGTLDLQDRITLISAANGDRISGGLNERELLTDWLKNLSTRFWPPNVAPVLSQADSLLRASDRYNRELYLISGFYGANWDSAFYSPTELSRTYLVPVGDENPSNVSIESVRLVSAIRRKGKPALIEAKFANHGATAVRAAPVSVYLEGERVAQDAIDIDAGSTIIREITLTPPVSGGLEGSVRLDLPDALQADNRSYFILDVPEKLKLLVLTPDELTSRIVAAALGVSEEEFISASFQNYARWETLRLPEYDALLLVDPPGISAGAAAKIVEFVSSGGGLILAPGAATDPVEFSRGLLARLGLGSVRNVIRGGVKWGRFDLEHPLFGGVFEEGGKPAEPMLDFAFDLGDAPDSRTIIPLSNGRPFLLEKQLERGRILLFASPPKPESGGLIFAGVFAPLLYRSVIYAASASGENAGSWTTGLRARLTLDVGMEGKEAKLAAPDGSETALAPSPGRLGVGFDAGRIESPGIYNLRIDGKVARRFAANPPAGSGRLVRANLESVGENFGGASILNVSGETLRSTVKSRRFGREFWKPLAAGFLLLLIAESVVAKPRREEV